MWFKGEKWWFLQKKANAYSRFTNHIECSSIEKKQWKRKQNLIWDKENNKIDFWCDWNVWFTFTNYHPHPGLPQVQAPIWPWITQGTNKFSVLNSVVLASSMSCMEDRHSNAAFKTKHQWVNSRGYPGGDSNMPSWATHFSFQFGLFMMTRV